MEIKKILLTNNDCYKAGKKMTPKGIVVHSTGANNPNLCRYIAPDDGLIGKNQYNNHWNQSGVSKCVHAMIGKDKNGTVRLYQTLPFDYKPWGCGSGTNGSYNNTHIQFEMLEDGLTDATYFNAVFSSAVEFCAYLCKEYNLSTDSIVSHAEAHKAGYASNHGDPENWLKKFGKSMNDLRADVKAKLEPVPAPAPIATYTVIKGDTLSKIAVKYKTTVDTLVKLNNIKNPSQISIGQIIKLPSSEISKPDIIYTVVKGDTLSKIANKHNTTVSKLASYNNIKNVNVISAEQKIKIPQT